MVEREAKPTAATSGELLSTISIKGSLYALYHR